MLAADSALVTVGASLVLVTRVAWASKAPRSGSANSIRGKPRWSVAGSEPVSIQDCAALCSRCSRCRYFSVSLSPDVTDCSWYHSCDLTRRLPPLRGASFVSMSLKGAQRYARVCRGRYGGRGAC